MQKPKEDQHLTKTSHKNLKT